MKIHARGIDPETGEPDQHGVPQMACPARRDDVIPQFTCRRCPCAAGVETHEAIDDLGQPFHLVDAVECTFQDKASGLPVVWQQFPNPSARAVKDVIRRTEAGVACPLPAMGLPVPPISLRMEGNVWVPVSHCRLCQFHRGVKGEISTAALRLDAGAVVVCSAPEMGIINLA